MAFPFTKTPCILELYSGPSHLGYLLIKRIQPPTPVVELCVPRPTLKVKVYLLLLQHVGFYPPGA